MAIILEGNATFAELFSSNYATYRDPCTEVANVQFWCSATHRWKRKRAANLEPKSMFKRGYRWEHRHFWKGIYARH